MAQSFQKNQESLWYIRSTDFRFLVGLVIIVFNKYKNINHREGHFYSLKVPTYLLHRFTADLIFNRFADLYGYNDRVILFTVTQMNALRKF